MKTLLSMILVFSSLSAFAAWPECTQYEAQFIGEVTQLKVYENHFTFKVRATKWMVPSVVCPLTDFSDAVLSYPGVPSIQNGDEISGVMVYEPATDSYKID